MMNKLIAIIIFVIFSPVFLVTAIAIFIDDGRPIFFHQKRVGINKSFFNIIKFRTMKIGTKDIATHLAQNDEQKFLRSGKFLRKYSIDELPQLLNIIYGDINFIGPRPALYNQYDLIEMRDKHQLHTLKPGITGWAQVNGRDLISLEEKVSYDLYYKNNKGIMLYLKIILKTLFKVLNASDIKA